MRGCRQYSLTWVPPPKMATSNSYPFAGSRGRMTADPMALKLVHMLSMGRPGLRVDVHKQGDSTAQHGTAQHSRSQLMCMSLGCSAIAGCCLPTAWHGAKAVW